MNRCVGDSGSRFHVKSGTGVMVSSWLMLTAGHNLPWKYVPSGNWWVEFQPACYNIRTDHLRTAALPMRLFSKGRPADQRREAEAFSSRARARST